MMNRCRKRKRREGTWGGDRHIEGGITCGKSRGMRLGRGLERRVQGKAVGDQQKDKVKPSQGPRGGTECAILCLGHQAEVAVNLSEDHACLFPPLFRALKAWHKPS